MGAKFGNLQIRGADVEQVAPLLPDALVGRWSEGFVSVYHQNYGWGNVDKAGRSLSRKLPEAVVLSVALFDEDVADFQVFQAGKRLTAHLFNPYEDKNSLGDISLFCQVLGLPEEDGPRLKALWKKGDGSTQVDLTGALLGAPLWADPGFLPADPVLRDTARVDAWLADHPDPPKIKSVTKAKLIQELTDVSMISGHVLAWDGFLCKDRDYRADPPCLPYTHFYHITPEGTLTPFEIPMQETGDARYVSSADCYWISPDRFLVGVRLNQERQDGSYFSDFWGYRLAWDSAGQLPLPLDFPGQWVKWVRSLPDGGLLVMGSHMEGQNPTTHFLQGYAPDGTLSWRKDLGLGITHWYTGWEEGFLFHDSRTYSHFLLDWRGEPLLEIDPGNPIGPSGERLFLRFDGNTPFLVRMDDRWKDVARSPALASHPTQLALPPDRQTIFLPDWKDIYLLNADDLSIRRQRKTEKMLLTPAADGFGRYWGLLSNSLLAGFDGELELVSRHKLKGDIQHLARGQAGDLLAYTYDYRRRIFRVYRIA